MTAPDRTAVAERGLQGLADTLVALLSREGDEPSAWASAAFARRVAAARSLLRSVVSPARLAAGLTPPTPREAADAPGFEVAARRLAGDAVTVAIAIRWLEVRRRAPLPAWPELLRRRSLDSVRTDPVLDVGLWFG